MRIAQIAPLHEAVPPCLYGGTERRVSFLTEEWVAMGHDVTLLASRDSLTTAELDAVWPQAPRLDFTIRDPIAPHMLMMEAVRRRAADFDIMHFHMDHWPFSLFLHQRTPFMTTMHGRLDLAELQPVFDAFPRVPAVGISESQRRALPQARWMGTVPHGLPQELLMPQGVIKPEYLAFLGRIAPEKGPDCAIRVARACGIPLRMAAKLGGANRPCFEQVVQPMLADGGVELGGEITDAEKPAFRSGAQSLLMPISWPEPFRLVLIEAMACATRRSVQPRRSARGGRKRAHRLHRGRREWRGCRRGPPGRPAAARRPGCVQGALHCPALGGGLPAHLREAYHPAERARYPASPSCGIAMVEGRLLQ